MSLALQSVPSGSAFSKTRAPSVTEQWTSHEPTGGKSQWSDSAPRDIPFPCLPVSSGAPNYRQAWLSGHTDLGIPNERRKDVASRSRASFREERSDQCLDVLPDLRHNVRLSYQRYAVPEGLA